MDYDCYVSFHIHTYTDVNFLKRHLLSEALWEPDKSIRDGYWLLGNWKSSSGEKTKNKSISLQYVVATKTSSSEFSKNKEEGALLEKLLKSKVEVDSLPLSKSEASKKREELKMVQSMTLDFKIDCKIVCPR